MVHKTPRMHDRPGDPAYKLLQDDFTTTPKIHRKGCYICEDMELARMGMPLCSPCCQCRKDNRDGHLAADNPICDDCGHEGCSDCADLPAQTDPICTCGTPCCEVDVGVGIITCGSKHCPAHGEEEE